MGVKNLIGVSAMEKKKKASRLGMVCYGLGDLASQFVWTYVGSYLTIYYTDVVGLAPLAVTVIMMLARIWDAVNDPMMGAITERTRSKFGRFRPYIAFGAPFLALFSVLTFVNPFGGKSTAGVIWAAATYIIAGMIYTLVNIPYGALAGVMTEDADQRNVINTFRNIGMNLGMVIVNGLSAGLALKFSAAGGQVADGHGYMMVAIIYGIIAVPMFLIVALTGREVVQPVNEEVRGFSFRETIANLVNNKYLMIITLIMVLQMTAFMGRIAVTAYYVIYCLGSFTMIGLIMTIPSIGGIIGSFFVPFFARKYGKRNVIMTAMAIQAVGLFIMYLAPFDNMKMVLAGDIIFGLFNVGFPMSLSMVSDSVDYMELKSGVRTDGTAYATYGLATKIGNAIGGAFGIMIMSAFGYVANAEQTVEALKGINITVNLIPAILFVISTAACLLWDMTDAQADEIRRKLAERHSGNSCEEEVTEGFIETAKAI